MVQALAWRGSYVSFAFSFQKNPTYCLNPADHLDVEIADGKKSPEIFTNTCNPGY
jgi:hypothetical protein